MHLKARGTRTLLYGRDEIELSHVEQIAEDGQVKAIWYAMAHARQRYMDGATPLSEVLQCVDGDVRKAALDAISPVAHPPDLVAFRSQELAAAINRLRSLRVASGKRG